MKTSPLLCLFAIAVAFPAVSLARDRRQKDHADYHRDHPNDYRSDRHTKFHRDNKIPFHRSRGSSRFYEPSFGFGVYGSSFFGRGYYDPYYDDPFYRPYDYRHEYRRPVATERLSVEASVQVALARRGFYNGSIDGVIGEQSRRAIRNYQSRRGLPVTGRIDNRLLDALDIG